MLWDWNSLVVQWLVCCASLQGGMGFIPGHTHGVAKNLKKGEGGRYKPSDKLFTMDLKDLVESGI